MLIDHADVRRWWTLAGGDIGRTVELAVSEHRTKAAGPDEDSAKIAARVLDGWTHSGARGDLKRDILALDQRFVVADAGPRRFPNRMSVRKPDGSRQLPAWSAISRTEFERVASEYASHSLTRAANLALMYQALAAWDKHPEIGNAAAAFEAAGIDLLTADELAEAIL